MNKLTQFVVVMLCGKAALFGALGPSHSPTYETIAIFSATVVGVFSIVWSK